MVRLGQGFNDPFDTKRRWTMKLQLFLVLSILGMVIGSIWAIPAPNSTAVPVPTSTPQFGHVDYTIIPGSGPNGQPLCLNAQGTPIPCPGTQATHKHKSKPKAAPVAVPAGTASRTQ